MKLKYEITNINHEVNPKLFRIKALKDIPEIGVKAGDLGGFVESEDNLSQYDSSWVGGEARVCGKARVYDNARVYNSAHVYENAYVCGNARVYDNAQVSSNALVSGKARVCDKAWVYGNAWVYDNARVYDTARVYDNAQVYDNARVCGKARVYHSARVCDNAHCQIIGIIEERQVHIIKQADNTWLVQCGCKSVTIDEILGTANKLRIEEAKHREVYDLHVKHVIEAAKMHIKIHDHKEVVE